MANPFDQFDQSGQSNAFDQFDQGAKPSFMDGLKRKGLLLARSGINAVSALPMMAADAGVGVRNAIERGTGLGAGDYELPSHMLNRGLDQMGMPKAQSIPEKIADFADTAILGAKLPVPSLKEPAPSNFVPFNPKQADFSAASKEGYVVPPSTVKPSFANKTMEALGGKRAIEEDARLVNSQVTSKLSNRAFGLPENTGPVGLDDLSQVRAAANPAYDAMRSLGTVKADPEYIQELSGIVKGSEGAAKTFGGPFSQNPVKPYIDALTSAEDIPASNAVDATKVLREMADKSYASGDKAAGAAFKKASDAVEGLLERAGTASGQGDLVKNFRQARQVIAQTYSAAKGVNEAAGTFDPTAMVRLISKGKPLTGDLRKMGEFAGAFPKVAKPLMDSPTRYTDVAFPVGLSVLSGHLAPLGIPLSRSAMRAYLLSPQGQKLALETAKNSPKLQALIQGLLTGGASQAQQ